MLNDCQQSRQLGRYKATFAFVHATLYRRLREALAMKSRIPRHEAWRQAYRKQRYCRHLTQQELNQRVRDVFVNILRLTPQAKIGLPPMDLEGVRGMELWTHVLEEMALRHGPYPNGFTRDILHSEPFPDFVGDLGKKPLRFFRQEDLKRARYLSNLAKPST